VLLSGIQTDHQRLAPWSLLDSRHAQRASAAMRRVRRKHAGMTRNNTLRNTLLGCRVDVLTENGLHWHIRDRVLKEAVAL
jgi:hypothetical protein